MCNAKREGKHSRGTLVVGEDFRAGGNAVRENARGTGHRCIDHRSGIPLIKLGGVQAVKYPRAVARRACARARSIHACLLATVLVSFVVRRALVAGGPLEYRSRILESQWSGCESAWGDA